MYADFLAPLVYTAPVNAGWGHFLYSHSRVGGPPFMGWMVTILYGIVACNSAGGCSANAAWSKASTGGGRSPGPRRNSPPRGQALRLPSDWRLPGVTLGGPRLQSFTVLLRAALLQSIAEAEFGRGRRPGHTRPLRSAPLPWTHRAGCTPTMAPGVPGGFGHCSRKVRTRLAMTDPGAYPAGPRQHPGGAARRRGTGPGRSPHP